MEGFEIGVAVITVIAFVLFTISILAYKRERVKGILFASVAFGLFLIKGVALSFFIFTSKTRSESDLLAIAVLFDVIILVFLFFTVLSPPKYKERPESNVKKRKEKKT